MTNGSLQPHKSFTLSCPTTPFSTSLSPEAQSQPFSLDVFGRDINNSASLVEAQTTAAAAQVDAPTATIAHEVEANAEHTQDAAHDAASIAHVGTFIRRVHPQCN